MKNITLYHGSIEIVKKPLYGYGKVSNDYGRGFYCTQDKELAKEWASNEISNGFVNTYSMNLDGLKVLDLTKGTHSVIEWLTLLIENREVNTSSRINHTYKFYLNEHFSIDISKYDVVIGYRADDSYYSFVRMFLNNQISVQQLSKIMKIGDLGKQVVLISPKAFDSIKFVNAEEVENQIYYVKKQNRMDEAMVKLKQETVYEKDGLFLIDIVREGINKNDKRLF